jgi:hypothetical protein
MFVAVLLLAIHQDCPPPVCQVDPQTYLYQPAFCLDYELRLPACPYIPQPGDIYLTTDQWWIAKWGHKLAHSGAPHHSGVVVALPNGRLALLEGGPFHSWDPAGLLDLIPALIHYRGTERIYIRQRAVPLTPEQSCRLTAFAMAAQGRPFAQWRMIAQAGPFTVKGPLRTSHFGLARAACFEPDNPEPRMRRNYFCSELATEALVAAGLLDPVTTRPTAMFPRELFFGTSEDRYIKKHLDMSEWLPPARWTECPGTEPKTKYRPWLDGDTSR